MAAQIKSTKMIGIDKHKNDVNENGFTTINNKKRRVIHIEFSNQELPTELNWAERLN